MSRNKTRWGHIEELSDDKFRIHWDDGYDSNGKRRKHSRTIYGTWEDAEYELAKEYIRRGGTFPDMTYEQLWDGIVEPSFEKRELAVRTIQGDKRVWNKELKHRIGKDIVRDTTPRRVESVLDEIKSAWVQRSTFSLWRKMINLAIHEGLDMRNPCTRYVCRKKAVPEQRPLLEAHEVMEWMENLDGFMYESIVLILAGSGMRVEEACALTIDDIEISDRYLYITLNKALVSTPHGSILKGMKTDDRFAIRTLAIGEPFASRIAELLPNEGIILSSKRSDNGYLNPNNFSRGYKKWCEAKKMKYVNAGKLRKSWSVMQGEAGSLDSLVSLAMGHSDGSTRGRNYQQLTRSAAVGLADALTCLIGNFAHDVPRYSHS